MIAVVSDNRYHRLARRCHTRRNFVVNNARNVAQNRRRQSRRAGTAAVTQSRDGHTLARLPLINRLRRGYQNARRMNNAQNRMRR